MILYHLKHIQRNFFKMFTGITIDKISFHERFVSKKGAPRNDHTNALEYGNFELG